MHLAGEERGKNGYLKINDILTIKITIIQQKAPE